MARHDTAAQSEEPQLDIVVVSAAGVRELLRACLRSLEHHPPRTTTYRAWLIDNASRDGTIEMVAREFPWVRVIALDTNCGFGPANNVVLRQTVAPQALLLNPDTELTEGAIDRALLTLRERRDAAVVGVRLVRRDGSFDHAAKRSFPTLLGALGEFTGVGRSSIAAPRLGQYRAPDVAEDGCGEVDAVNGAFMLIRREAIEQVGLFDERYGMYGEDLDWCYRFKRAGWAVLYDGSVSVVHVKGAVSVIDTGRGRHRILAQNIAFHRAMGRFYRKFHGGSNAALDTLVYAALGLKTAISVIRSALARRGQRA
jgi:N-acetylglucosaminyl-diphospho-decaprenol L-rhamnosyltransferase